MEAELGREQIRAGRSAEGKGEEEEEAFDLQATAAAHLEMREREESTLFAVHACDGGSGREEFLGAVVLRGRVRKDLGA
jgi:hypothetical protein